MFIILHQTSGILLMTLRICCGADAISEAPPSACEGVLRSRCLIVLTPREGAPFPRRFFIRIFRCSIQYR